MDYIEISAKTVDDCITDACEQFTVTSDRLDYEVVSEGSTGFLGLKVKPAIIRVRVKSDEDEIQNDQSSSIEEHAEDKIKEEKTENKETKTQKSVQAEEKSVTTDNKQISYVYDHDFITKAKEFSSNVFSAMNMKVNIDAKYNETDKVLEIELSGDEMGVLIGKRGQTLDSLQYLISLVVNRDSEEYIHVKVDTENYRSRRKATLENLAKNIAYKVRKNRQSVSLEPMNPYERRIIHSALQADKYVTTHSEGEEPFRRVVVTLKK